MSGLTRREAVTLGALGLAGSALAGCSKVMQATLPARRAPESVTLPETGDLSPVARMLNRAGFGPAPGDAAHIAKVGASAYLDEQLAAPTDDSKEEPGLQIRLATIDALHADGFELRDIQDAELLRQLQQAAFLRAVYSPWQLRERAVDFWTNHFNIYAKKAEGYTTPYKAVDDTVVIRQHALTSFPAMLKASAKSPAMLVYLDNQKNRKGVANENYAREIMELHTLGVHGGYTQKDVQEVARCLTGWTLEDRFLKDQGTFRFDPERHDNGEKIVLGHKIPAGMGRDNGADGEYVLDLLAKHPSTAKFISTKLVRYFYGTEDAATIASTASVYLKTDGDISAMLRHLLVPLTTGDAPPSGYAPILKRPFDFVVSALRATDANTDGDTKVQDYLEHMGQALFLWPMPDGYPDKTTAWTGSLLQRWNFAIALLGGKIEGTTVPDLNKQPVDRHIEAVFARRANDPLLADIRTAVAGLPAREAVGLMIASPAFQWR